MEKKYNVVFTGNLREGSDRQTVLARFADRFNVSEEKAAAMLPVGGETILKKHAERATAEQFQRLLEELGVIVVIREAEQSAVVVQQGESDLDGRAFNPYEKVAPMRSQQSESESDADAEDVAFTQKVFEGAVSVPPSRGVKWLTEAYSNHVKKDLGAWIGAVVLYFVLSLVLSLIPIIGSIGLMLIGPVLIAGFMVGAQEQAQGGSFTIGHLFRGFDESPGQLMLVALLYFVGAIVIGILVFSMVGFSFFTQMAAGSANPTDIASMMLPVLVIMLFMFPLLMAYWFAPALVALDGLSAVEAMKQSFKGCLKNMLPLLIYSLVGALLAFVAAIPLMLGFILLLPVMIASMYVAYGDIFRSSEHVFTP